MTTTFQDIPHEAWDVRDTMHMRGSVVHTQYVDVLCTATCYLGTLAGSLLHVVVSGTVATWDAGATVVLLLAVSTYA